MREMNTHDKEHSRHSRQLTINTYVDHMNIERRTLYMHTLSSDSTGKF